MQRAVFTLVALLGLCAAADTHAADAAAQRFRIDARLTPLNESADGRFRVEASARHQPDATSADARFTLKATNANCAPAVDAVFADGFE